MIRVELAELVCIYVVVFLAAILAVWIAYEMARRVRENRSRRGWLRCKVCAMEFEDLARRPPTLSALWQPQRTRKIESLLKWECGLEGTGRPA